MKKRVNMDVDGVVADFAGHLFNCLEQAGFEPPDLTDPKWHVWDIFSVMPIEQRTFSFELLTTRSFWTEIPPIAGAQEALLRIREAGHHVQWVTSPWTTCFGWADYRRQWLDANFAHQSQDLNVDLTVTGSKSEVWADVFVDDKVENVLGWHKHHPAPRHRGIVYKNHFNRLDGADLDGITWTESNVNSVLKFLER